MEVQRINMIGSYLKQAFGKKVVKLSLEGGFTCPNRDGTKGTGGCIFCSAGGSGEFAGSISSQIRLLSDKWPDAKYIAYFQSHTNTYAPVGELREKFEAALDQGRGSCPLCKDRPDIIGLAVATRPDCLDDSIYELLDELNRKTFLWVELGLQSAVKETGETINRCHSLETYDEAVKKLASLGIRTVSHIILGLPKHIEPCRYDACGNLIKHSFVIPETKEEMLFSVKHACAPSVLNRTTGSDRIFGIKLHMLNVIRGSQMETLCPDYVPFESIDEYTDLVIEALKIIPRSITIHRLSADAPRPILISPEWSYKKRTILNTINKKMAERDIYQGQDAI